MHLHLCNVATGAESRVQAPAIGWRFWLQWTLLTTAVSAVVFVLSHWRAALSFAAALGALQWLLLRPRLKLAKWWVPASIVAWPLGLAASYLVHALSAQLLGVSHLPIALYAAAATAVVGAVQWLLLRRELSGAGWWIPANAVGWGLGFGLGFRAGGASALTLALGGLLSGAIGGAVTGAVLVWLLRRQKASPS